MSHTDNEQINSPMAEILSLLAFLAQRNTKKIDPSAQALEF